MTAIALTLQASHSIHFVLLKHVGHQRVASLLLAVGNHSAGVDQAVKWALVIVSHKSSGTRR